ncbi:MAG: hypothetical protein V4582_16705 [Pseudomonadota bacterium]
MDKEFDELLGTPLLEVPEHFTRTVMGRVAAMPAPARPAGLRERIQELALILGGLAGAAQLASFMFGIWAVSSAN